MPIPPEMRETIARVVHQQTNEDGGCTISPEKGDLAGQPGYAVSMYPERERVVPLDDFTACVLSKYMRDNDDLLDRHGYALGTWINEGSVYLDIVRVVPDLWSAMEAGFLHKQKAIFDLEKRVEIPLVYLQDSVLVEVANG